MEKSLFRKLLNLVIVLLILHAGWRVGPVFFRHFAFKDKITEAARYSGQRPAAEIEKEILAIAQTEGVPLDPKTLAVEKTRNRVRIDTRYTENLELLPSYFYPYEFSVSIDTALARPTSVADIR